MSDPKRLRDLDDGLAAALRAEIDDDARLPVAAVRGRVVASVASGALPATLLSSSITAAGAAPWLIGVALVGALAGAAVVGSTRAPVVVAAPSSVASPSPALSSPAPSSPAQPTLPSSTPPSPERPARVVVSAPSSANLADELSLFERGQGALENGRPAIAAREMRAYLERYPNGRLRDEAVRVLVDALRAAGRDEEADEEQRTRR